MTNIFVAKLDFGVSDDALKALFDNHGTVIKCHIAKDRETGKPRGFAFVEMSTAAEAEAAIQALDGHAINGRNMVVKLAEDRGNSKPRPQRDNREQRSAPRPQQASNDRSDKEEYFAAPIPPVSDDVESIDTPKAAKRGKNKKKKSTDKPESREFKMSAYKKSGKRSRIDFEDDDDWELELLRQKRRGWSDEEE
jgi:RNA recognition motif-containing protein